MLVTNIGRYQVLRLRRGWYVVPAEVQSMSHIEHVFPPFRTKPEALDYARALMDRHPAAPPAASNDGA